VGPAQRMTFRLGLGLGLRLCVGLGGGEAQERKSLSIFWSQW